MGSWNFTCALSELPICSGDKVKWLLVTQTPYIDHKQKINVYSEDLWSVRTLPVDCVYEDMGYVELTQETVDSLNFKIWKHGCEIQKIDNFESAYKLLQTLGLKQKCYQETRRETWSVPIKGVKEIVFDYIPGLPPYVELDCTTNKILTALVKKLGFDPKDAKYGSYSNSFEELYGIPRKTMNNNIPELTFSSAKQVLGPLIKKNYSLFQKYT